MPWNPKSVGRRFQKGEPSMKGMLGKHHTEETKEKIRRASLRFRHSLATRLKLSEGQKGRKGSNWRGGLTPENERIRTSIEIRLWREAVFARDNWTCQQCGARSESGKEVYLMAHHIKSFAKFPKLRTSIENGLTLCRKCHYKLHSKK